MLFLLWFGGKSDPDLKESFGSTVHHKKKKTIRLFEKTILLLFGYILIERLEGVVEPNVSPGKKSSPTAATPSSTATPTPQPDRPNMIPIKRKIGSDPVPVIVR
jgi:hypothetical protein